MSHGKKGNFLKKALPVAFVIYLAAVFYITIFSRPAEERRFDMEPFNSYIMLIRDKNVFYMYQSFCNILMTIPLGIMLPLMSDKYKSFKRIISCGFLFSAFIEFVQYISCRGLCEFDDLFNNTLGAVIGYWLFLLIFSGIFIKKKQKRK